MKKTKKCKKRSPFLLLTIFILSLLIYSCQDEVEFLELSENLILKATVSINNSGFESYWSDWTDIDPSSISGESYAGIRSAKITGSGGKFKQNISVTPNTNYTLSAYVLGKGTIGATVSGSNIVNGGTYSSWTKVNVNFNSGSNSTITIFGRYRGGTGRFDNFSLVTNNSTSVSRLSVSSVSASSHDGNVPSNTLDGSLSTRWSANGSGQYITYDLGSEKSVSKLKIAWYKGNQRKAYFKIRAGKTLSSLSTVYNASSSGSSGNTLQLETYNFSAVTARYIRITGLGNSSNSWNSITETQIWGSSSQNGGGLNPNLPPSSNFDLSDWYVSVPVDNNGDGKADSIKENQLNQGY